LLPWQFLFQNKGGAAMPMSPHGWVCCYVSPDVAIAV